MLIGKKHYRMEGRGVCNFSWKEHLLILLHCESNTLRKQSTIRTRWDNVAVEHLLLQHLWYLHIHRGEYHKKYVDTRILNLDNCTQDTLLFEVLCSINLYSPPSVDWWLLRSFNKNGCYLINTTKKVLNILQMFYPMVESFLLCSFLFTTTSYQSISIYV